MLLQIGGPAALGIDGFAHIGRRRFGRGQLGGIVNRTGSGKEGRARKQEKERWTQAERHARNVGNLSGGSAACPAAPNGIK